MSELPLSGHVILDASRMLPGAVLTRMLVDLGARVIKIEDPGSGDPMRHSPPIVDGVGAGFRAFFRGVESVGLDLRTAEGASALRRLALRSDVLIESFRPGTLSRWGLAPEALMEANARLIVCSLSGFGQSGPMAGHVAHDLNLVAMSGLMSQLPAGFPRVQIADVTTGMLAASSILAALLQRHRTGRGRHLDQPLALGPLPFLTWAWADASASPEPGLLGTVIAGESPCYRIYTCADGRQVVLGAIEPKFWQMLTAGLGLDEHQGHGLDLGESGEAAARAVQGRFAQRPAAEWVAWAAEAGIPLTVVNDLEGGMREPYYAERMAPIAVPGRPALEAPGAFLAGWEGGRTAAPAPAVGEHTARVMAEFGTDAVGQPGSEPSER